MGESINKRWLRNCRSKNVTPKSTPIKRKRFEVRTYCCIWNVQETALWNNSEVAKHATLWKLENSTVKRKSRKSLETFVWDCGQIRKAERSMWYSVLFLFHFLLLMGIHHDSICTRRTKTAIPEPLMAYVHTKTMRDNPPAGRIESLNVA